MSGRISRSKGKRGELEVMHLLGKDFKRTGYAGTDNPDVSSDWAIVSVKNKATPISLSKVLQELIKLEAQDSKKNHYVAVKVAHKWIIVERLEQMRDAHC